MSGELDARLRPKAKELILKYGKTVTFHVPDSKTYDPETGQVTETGVQDKGVVVSPPRGFEASMVNADTVREGDRRFLMYAKDATVTPVAGLEVTMDGERWTVVHVAELFSGELIAAWDVQVRL